MNPLIPIVILLAASLFVAVAKKANQIRVSSLVFAVLGGIAVFALALPVLLGSSTESNNLWLIDKFSALMAILIATVYVSGSIVSYRYIWHELEEKVIGLRAFRVYHVLLPVFALCMLATVLTNNTILLWLALEGTTLSTTFLVGLYRKKQSVEAAWKYIIICSTGISLGLLGILLFSWAQSLSGVAGPDIFTLTELAKHASLLSSDIVRWAFIFLFIGFGTKLGIAPMHVWLPDAHSNAPSPISAMFSGILLNVALYAVIRFKFITDLALGSTAWSSRLFLFFGVVSILVAALMMLAQKNYKRMLAYSSVEHMGILTFALSLSPIGAIASVIHMIGHTLTKSLLFFGAGEILLARGTTKTAQIKGLLKQNTYTAILFLLGILAIIAIPPSVLFVSEFAIFANAFALHPVISIIIFLGLSIIAYAMLRSTISMFLEGEEQTTKKERWNVTHTVMTVQLILIVGLTVFVTTRDGINFVDSIAKNSIYFSTK